MHLGFLGQREKGSQANCKQGNFRLQGKELSAGEDEIEKGAGRKPEGTQWSSCVTPGACPQLAFIDLLPWRLQALP